MNNNIRNVCFGPQVIQNKTIQQFQATEKKRGLICILLVILFLVYMKVNFAAILDFFIQIYSPVTF